MKIRILYAEANYHAIVRKRGPLDGLEWESAVIAEIYKQIKAADLPIHFYHLRTLDGREVDLLMECDDGFIAVECKQTVHPSKKDFQAMRRLPELLDKPLLAGLVICNEDAVRRWPDAIPLYSVPAAWVLS